MGEVIPTSNPENPDMSMPRECCDENDESTLVSTGIGVLAGVD
jgi:hypothetical protein